MLRPSQIANAICLAAFATHTAIAADTMPADVKQSIDKCLIGEFEVTSTVGDERSTGTFTASWMPGETCVRLEAKHSGPNGVDYWNGVMGWHADSKTLVQHGFDADGYWTITYTDIRPKEWFGTWKGYIDGQMQHSKSVFKATDQGWEYRDTTNGMELVYRAKRRR